VGELVVVRRELGVVGRRELDVPFGDFALDLRLQDEAHELAGEVGVVCVGKQRHPLGVGVPLVVEKADLVFLEVRVVPRGEHLVGGVGDHHRRLAFAPGAVGVAPGAQHPDVVVLQVRPVVEVAVRAVLVDRVQQERPPGRRGGGVLGDQIAAVLLVEEPVERLGRLDRGAVVHRADVPRVVGDRAAVGIER
jgi:hypothetical protein